MTTPHVDGTTWCILHGGPADGMHLPTADHCCTRRIVIYRIAEPGKKGSELDRPAVYLRDETDQGTYEHRGMDGVARTFASLGYRFERSVDKELAAKIERVRHGEIDAERADRRSL